MEVCAQTGPQASPPCSLASSPETLALKALILHSSLPHNHPTASSQPKGEEVDHLIEAALRKDPYSHITHHVNSIIARANKDYDTACRSLSRAREIDPDNMPLMRDAISLHTQLGQHKESLRVRHKYFTMRPNLRSHWISLAVGHELCGNNQEALSVFLGLEESTKVSFAWHRRWAALISHHTGRGPIAAREDANGLACYKIDDQSWQSEGSAREARG